MPRARSIQMRTSRGGGLSLRRWFRRLGMSLAALLLALSVFLVPTIWGKPWSIDHWFLRVLAEVALEHPMLMSFARILEPYGLDFYSDDLEDFSVDAERRLQSQAERIRKELDQWNPAELTDSQRLSSDVLRWFLDDKLAHGPFLFHDYPVQQMEGLQALLPDFMLNIHRVDSARAARNYVTRLEAFGVALDQIGERARFRQERGIVPPRFVLEAVRRQIAELVAPAPAAHPLATHLEEALATLGTVPAEQRESLLAQARAAITEVIAPAYGRLDALLAEQERIATNDAGVWRLPDGDAYYRAALRSHTTTSLTPDEVHAIGRSEVTRIQTEMRVILAAEGIDASDLRAALGRLAHDERHLYPDTDDGRAAILADYTAILRDAETRLPALFGRLPKAPVMVDRVPGFKEKGSAGAYYNPPSFDGARPGVFFANLRAPREVVKYGMRTLTYHEAVPGHHLQIALSFEQHAIPFFRRVIPFTAFIEGWALYAERLAGEQGFHPTPLDRLGQLQAELFRAVRLVVDTGIHAKRWTREQAIEWMLANTGMGEVEVTAEIERYIVLPGQACAYKIGQMKLLELRERARTALGSRLAPDAFLRAFHDAVLANGALPLEVLDVEMDRWIAQQR